MALPIPEIAEALLLYQRLIVKIQINHSTTAANTKAFAVNCPALKVYNETDTLTGDDSDTNYSGLDNDASPSIFGVLLLAKDVADFVAASVDAQSITAGAGITWSAATFTTAGGTPGKGVTSNKNLALQMSCTGMDAHAANAVSSSCYAEFKYRTTQPGS